jgi:hypothetical protein
LSFPLFHVRCAPDFRASIVVSVCFDHVIQSL